MNRSADADDSTDDSSYLRHRCSDFAVAMVTQVTKSTDDYYNDNYDCYNVEESYSVNLYENDTDSEASYDRKYASHFRVDAG